MAWVNPTSTVDSGGTWTDDDNARDGNTGTFAYSANNNNDDALELNINAISCDKIQIYACKYKKSEDDVGAVVDVYYSSDWHNVITATLTANTWTEGAIGSTEIVTAARVTPSGLSAGNAMRLKALQFNEIAGPTAKSVDGSIFLTGALGLVLSLSRVLSGALRLSGNLLKTVVRYKVVSGVLNLSGDLIKKYIKPKSISGLINFTGGLISKYISVKALSGSLNISGAITKVLTLSRTIGGSLRFAGSLATDYIPGMTQKAISGVVNFAGGLIKAISKSPAGLLNFSGNIERHRKIYLLVGNINRKMNPDE